MTADRSAAVLQVDIWADIVCPWCYIGRRRFQSAVADFGHADAIEITYRSFELDPNRAAEPDGTLDQHLAAKYGVSLAEAAAMNDRVTRIAAEEGLAYRLDIARPGNSFDAHRLTHHARTAGRDAEMLERLYAAYFSEGRAIGDRATLVDLAGDVGLDREVAAEVLASTRHADDVRGDEQLARQLGIGGVPFFVLGRRYGISGAQPAELMRSALERAWSDPEVVPA